MEKGGMPLLAGLGLFLLVWGAGLTLVGHEMVVAPKKARISEIRQELILILLEREYDVYTLRDKLSTSLSDVGFSAKQERKQLNEEMAELKASLEEGWPHFLDNANSFAIMFVLIMNTIAILIMFNPDLYNPITGKRET